MRTTRAPSYNKQTSPIDTGRCGNSGRVQSKRCKHCTKSFKAQKYNQLFCSAKCQADSYYATNAEAIKKRHVERRKHDPEGGLLQAAEARAKKRSVVFNLKRGDLPIPTHCPVCGTELKVNVGVAGQDSFTIDRLDPKGPYVPANCCVICRRCNAYKSDMNLEQQLLLVLHVVRRLGQSTKVAALLDEIAKHKVPL